jgi:hypothetical protein
MLPGRTGPILGPSHKATWVVTRPVAIRISLLLSHAQTLRDGRPEGALKGLCFSPLDGKARSICASLFESSNLE